MLKLRQPTLIIAITAFAFIGFVVWSLWAEIDQVTRAPGQVIPSGRTQIVQSQDGGTISEILVREGERVRKGQLLVLRDLLATKHQHEMLVPGVPDRLHGLTRQRLGEVHAFDLRAASG